MSKLKILLLLSSLVLCACNGGTPKDIQVEQSVQASQYLGRWYEIIRLDHSFERGLEQVTATYTQREDGGIKVINRGYDPVKQTWQEAEGKAYFLDPPNADGSFIGRLKVSFFGPFYGGYNIIALDKPYYNYVMVCGPDRSYLWILSRTPQLPYPIKQHLMAKAKELGFDTNALIYVKQ